MSLKFTSFSWEGKRKINSELFGRFTINNEGEMIEYKSDERLKLFRQFNIKDDTRVETESLEERKRKEMTEERKKLLLERFPFMTQYFGEIIDFYYLDNLSKFRVGKSVNSLFNIYHYIDINEVKLEPISIDTLKIDGMCITWNKDRIIRKEFYINGDSNFHEIFFQAEGKERRFFIDHVNKIMMEMF